MDPSEPRSGSASTVRAEGVRIGQHAAARRVLLHRVDRRSRRVDRPSALAAPFMALTTKDVSSSSR